MFNNNLIALIVAAGAGAFVYAQFGKRVGYGNGKRLWTIVAVVFVVTYLIVVSSLYWFI